MRRKIITIIILFLCNFAYAQKQLLKMGLFTDCQAAQTETKKGRYYTQSTTKLKEAIREFNDNDTKLVVSLGDLIDRDLYTLKQIDTILWTLKKPLYNLLGNHDFLLDSMSTVERIMNQTPPYYRSVVQNGVRLILLNTNEQTIYSTRQGTQERALAENTLAEYKKTGAMNAQPYNGIISQKQLGWLEDELKKATAANEIVIVMSHHPLIYLLGVGTVLNSEEVISLLERYDCVKAHFSGHCHMGGYFTRNNIHYLTFRGMVETQNNRYSVIDIYDNKIVIQGIGDELHRELNFCTTLK